MSIKVTVNGKDYSSNTALPIKVIKLLDERLDESRMSMRHTRTKLFPIGAVVAITPPDESGGAVEEFIISSDTSNEIPVGSGYYNHEITLIEPTKILEGIIVETLTFDNALGRLYDIPKQDVVGVVSPTPSGGLNITPKVWTQAPLDLGTTLYIPSTLGLDMPISTNGIPYPATHPVIAVKVTNPDGDIIFSGGASYDGTEIKLEKIGEYNVTYTYGYSFALTSGNYDVKYTFVVIDSESKQPLPKWTITSVIDRVLNLAEPHLQSETPRFKLNAEQAAEFAKIQAPEFAFTQMTLKEILDQIGGYIHGIPRLIRGESGEFDTIHYDMLGGTEPALIADPKYAYITEIRSHNIENYATELDSSVDNLVNTLDDGEGGVTEPYAGGFKTVRSEEQYARITDGNMIVSTTLPIYKVQKLEVLDPNNKLLDITAYVFEGSDYGRLSSFDGNYPTSKAYAVYYELGQKNIKGLSYKSPNIVGGAQSNYAITNIIKAAGGEDISAGWWSDNGNRTGNYPKLAFRITYTPIFSARVLQHKPYHEAGALKRTLIYNQGASLVETRFYGENLKGAIARMGNPEMTRTYRLRYTDYNLIPTPGQLWDDEYYVANVSIAYYPWHFDCMVELSKDFNRLSQYIGINSTWRAYEVSEKKAYNRDLVYSDYVVVGDPVEGDFKQLMSLDYVRNTFVQTYGSVQYPMTAANIITYDENGNDMHRVTLPVISTSFGNSLVFGFYMQDNYSAGAKSVYRSNSDVSGYWQTDVPYCDYYGRIETLWFSLCPRGAAVEFNGAAGFDMPQGLYGGPVSGAKMDTDDRLVVKKNGAEILRLSYQIHYTANVKSLILGPALTHNCPLVRAANPERRAGLYVLDKKVGKFDTVIELGSASLVKKLFDSEILKITNRLQFNDLTIPAPTVSGVAWAIADGSTGEILLAENVPITSGVKIKLPTLTFTHKLP